MRVCVFLCRPCSLIHVVIELMHRIEYFFFMILFWCKEAALTLLTQKSSSSLVIGCNKIITLRNIFNTYLSFVIVLKIINLAKIRTIRTKILHVAIHPPFYERHQI